MSLNNQNIEMRDTIIREYKNIEIEEAVKCLEDEEAEVAKLYYGLKRKKIVSNDELGQFFEIWDIEEYIYELNKKMVVILEDPINYLKEERRPFFSNLVDIYGKDSVMWAIEGLSKKEKSIICLYYGIMDVNIASNTDIKEIENIANLHETIDKIHNKIIKSMKKESTNTAEEFISNKSIIMEFIDMYGVDKIEWASSYLSDNDRNFANLYFKLSLNNKDILKTLSNKSVRSKLITIRNKLSKVINSEQERRKTNKKLAISVDLFDECDNKEIYRILSCLSSEQQYFILQIEKLNQKYMKSYFEIAEALHISDYDLFRFIKEVKENVKLEKKEIEEEKLPVKQLIEKRQSRLKEILGTTNKDKVINGLKELDIRESKIIELYFGVNGEVRTIEQLSEIFKEDKNVIRENIKSAVNNLKKAKIHIKGYRC